MSTDEYIQPLGLGPMPQPWARLASLGIRVAVWCVLFGLVYLLRSFFLLILLTFVFSYIQSHGVERLKPYISNRPLRVVIAGIAILSILIAVGFFLVPRVQEQAELFADRYPIYFKAFDEELESWSTTYPILRNLLPEWAVTTKAQHSLPFDSYAGQFHPTESPSARLISQLLGFNKPEEQEKNMRQIFGLLREIGRTLVAIVSAFLLSLLFSFLIVLDLPSLTRTVTSLRNTKLHFVYDEVADGIHNFGRVLGRSLEAQLVIAVLNTLLTAILIYNFGLGRNLAFLSAIVFFCSLIPIAGVFISSVPICLIVLQQSGIGAVFLAILAIWIIHMVECYILNPRIYGHHLRLNPVIVLIVLTICGKLFHVWGLVLGLPVCKYFFGHAIQYEKPDPEDLG